MPFPDVIRLAYRHRGPLSYYSEMRPTVGGINTGFRSAPVQLDMAIFKVRSKEIVAVIIILVQNYNKVTFIAVCWTNLV